MEARQFFPSATNSASIPRITGCSSFSLPANGILLLGDGQTLTLSSDTVFQPACQAPLAHPAIITNGGITTDQTSASDPEVADLRDPFYASTFPQCYALAATTVIAYTLVIMLLVAPRSFLDGGVVVLGKRGFTSPNNGISIGGRPWLQKVAALSVAVSLTIATVDTFRVAEDQYKIGNANAEELQRLVAEGTQLKIIRIISDTFLWLAQAQTLIRLFPRQREKVIIKWTAFALITLDVIFGALNSFQYTGPGNTRPRSFTDAVPALNYLFQLSLGLLYAAWVIYYSLMKKRYAFYHPLMKNISLMAMLSILAVIVPVVFFILDISKSEFTAWGDYVRWVGAAAASVIVWEWVERIEALEREEKKDGILGREVFDGDEMIDLPSSEYSWPRRRKTKKGDDDDGGESGTGNVRSSPPPSERSKVWPAMSSIASRYRSRGGTTTATQSPKTGNPAATAARSAARFLQPPLWPSRPPPAVTPVSRTDTASADSTVYAVRYQPVSDTTSRTPTEALGRAMSRTSSNASNAEPGLEGGEPAENTPRSREASPERNPAVPEARQRESRAGWASLTQLMKSRTNANRPPAEVVPHTQRPAAPQRDYDEVNRWDIRGRMEDFAATQAERIREKMRPTPDTESLPVTVIPAPPRRGAALAQLLEEDEPQATPTSQSHLTADNTAAAPARGAASRASPLPSPALRHDTLQLRPTRRETVSTPSEGLSPTSGTPRRPVDDILTTPRRD
ncbi:pH-response regulator protein palH/prr-4 [Apiospora rasikravindrae]|uniref:PH-response regulator protein palH/prr-4 n=1 Tax=Apiospora rasikravindrae TaxID=990691 RepID=A0ABR1UCF4_9PEZI